jgi:hypothetical protein
MAQITSVTSELLQAKIRQVLPSQQGFGEDLQASNVILPVIDLTPTAEGTSTPISMQQAIAFGSNTAFNVVGTTTTIVNNTGFYRITGVINVFPSGSVSSALDINMTDGLSTVSVYKTSSSATSTVVRQNFDFDKIFFVKSGISINVTTSSTCQFSGSVRQIADVNGNLVNPNGFTPQ